jgi:two-component sensor histidine kinase/PAS domain-containing protein
VDILASRNKSPAVRPGEKPGKPSPFYALAPGLGRELGIAVAFVAMVSAVRWALGHLFPGLGVFSLYFPAVLLAALIGGWRSGLAAMALTGIVVMGLFVKPQVSVRLTDPASPGNLTMIAVAAAPLVFVGHYVRTLLARLRGSADALTDRNLHYDAMFESMLEGYALCEAIWADDGKLVDYTIVEMNPALQRMLGVGPEAIGTRVTESPGDWTPWLRFCGRVLKTGEAAGFERHNPETDRWHEIRVTRVTDDLMAQVFFDITERKRADFRQAELFDELNHRVSNNLTLVSSILKLKARATDNEGVREQLLRTEARVHSIAQVHRALYRGGRTDRVEFGAYLRDLCESIKESATLDDRVAVEVTAEPIVLPVDTAIPLGMVVNELVTNAIKYAYPFPARGLISVNLTGANGELRLEVKDDGPGLSEDTETASTGLGMRLVKSLVSQVDGTFTVHRSPGATFEISIPASPRE